MGDYTGGGEMKEKSLSVILDEIEQRAGRASAMHYSGNVTNAQSAQDVPDLVKALRRQLAFIENTAGVLSPHSVELLKKEITTILTSTKEEP